MSIELTQEQMAVVARGEAVRVSEGGADLVLVRADVFERLRADAQDDFDPREAYPLVDLIMADDDANDPHLKDSEERR